jgi:guanylate kinase
MEANDEFIETANVHGNFYGTAKAGITKIQDQKKIPLLDIDVQGAVNFEKKFPNSNFIFVCPPSLQHVQDRLIKRGTETEKSMKVRMENASGEVDYLLHWREKINYRIFNDDLETSKTTLLNLLRALYPKELGVKDLIETT